MGAEQNTLESVESPLSEDATKQQLSLLKKGTQYVKLLRPATIDGGIFRLSKSDLKASIERFDATKDDFRLVKFVPASGAATRMFKTVFSWIEDPEQFKSEIKHFFKNAEKLAFFESWVQAADKADLETFESGPASKIKWLKLLVENEGMAMSDLPKALIPFHLYEEAQTPIAEHMKEGMQYANQGGIVRIHFTVSPEHESAFQKEVERLKSQEPFAQYKWEVSFSAQDPSTNTIALDSSGDVVTQNGKVLTRPGGHGALIHNLNALEADVVFIKNIDNVAHDRLLDITVSYKKAIAGVLFDLRSDLMHLHNDLGKGLVDEQAINDLRDKWKIRVPRDYKKLKKYLKRPMRVCGMVENQGEPGGGPFWSIDPFTGESLQILEQVQIDPKDSRQQNIAQTATHFNPVDIVCCKTDFKGNSIDLKEYINEDLFFAAKKTYKNQEISVLEWPGLWNGAMANWITIFVEVPIETFNPVKEITDLFRTNHQI